MFKLTYRGKRGAERNGLSKSSTRAGRLFLRQKTSPPEAIKGKSPECSGLQLDVFWQAALPVGKAAAIEVRLSSETPSVT
jgi:hypothetical protein